MVYWIRALIAVSALVAFFAGGGVWSGKPTHGCDGMGMAMADSTAMAGEGNDGGIMPGCPALTCASAQFFPPHQTDFALPVVIELISSARPRDDLERSGTSRPPNLRPPII